MDFDLVRGFQILERTPAVLKGLLAGLTAEWTASNEGGDSFSPFDVVGHLIDGEETDWIPRVEIILGPGPDRRFAPFDRFRHRLRNRGRDLDSLLDELAGLREGNLRRLRGFNLGGEDLARTGQHPELGEVSLGQLLATWVVHDLGHIAQTSRVMARQYTGAVGPWRAYLPVLGDRAPDPAAGR